ncbi:MAG: hypothetical protein GY711_02885 [bacterium]|nr:hypothetical protein [bacterium]
MPEIRALSLFLACTPALAQDCPQYLAPDPGEANLRFGDSVAVEGGTALVIQGNTFFVGAPRKDGAAPDSGTVYAFERPAPGGAWVQVNRFESSSPVSGQRFGRRLALDGEWLFVESTTATHVFQFDSDTRGWAEHQQLPLGPPAVPSNLSPAARVTFE